MRNKLKAEFKAGPNPKFSGYVVRAKEVKAQNLGDGVGCPDGGDCIVCGLWDSELKRGLCPDCRTPDAICERTKKAIREGTANGIVTFEDMGKPGISHLKRK
jgi:hypothetical protein